MPGASRVPVLLFHGDRDVNVNIDQSRTMHAALEQAGVKHELVVYPGLDHQLDEQRGARGHAAALRGVPCRAHRPGQSRARRRVSAEMMPRHVRTSCAL